MDDAKGANFPPHLLYMPIIKEVNDLFLSNGMNAVAIIEFGLTVNAYNPGR